MNFLTCTHEKHNDVGNAAAVIRYPYWNGSQLSIFLVLQTLFFPIATVIVGKPVLQTEFTYYMYGHRRKR